MLLRKNGENKTWASVNMSGAGGPAELEHTPFGAFQLPTPGDSVATVIKVVDVEYRGRRHYHVSFSITLGTFGLDNRGLDGEAFAVLDEAGFLRGAAKVHFERLVLESDPAQIAASLDAPNKADLRDTMEALKTKLPKPRFGLWFGPIITTGVSAHVKMTMYRTPVEPAGVHRVRYSLLHTRAFKKALKRRDVCPDGDYTSVAVEQGDVVACWSKQAVEVCVDRDKMLQLPPVGSPASRGGPPIDTPAWLNHVLALAPLVASGQGCTIEVRPDIKVVDAFDRRVYNSYGAPYVELVAWFLPERVKQDLIEWAKNGVVNVGTRRVWYAHGKAKVL